MRVAYIDCSMGAAGDMLTAALIELLPEDERNTFVDEFNKLGIPGVTMSIAPSEKCGITGTHVTILVDGVEESEHMHAHHHEDGHDYEHTHAHSHHDGEHEHEHTHSHSHHEDGRDYEHTHAHQHHDGEHEHEHTHAHDHHEDGREYEHTHSHSHHEDGHDYEHTHAHHHHDGKHEHEHTHSHDHNGEHHQDNEQVHEHIHADGTRHSHSHHGTADIAHIVNDHMELPDKVKRDILAVYDIIAAAESKVHGMPVTEVHFHEVGTMDALADVTAVCMLMDRLSPEQVIASPINTGSGTVKCAHGILPVPAPATANILIGMPAYSNGIMSELCTPTGAALIRHFATDYGNMPLMATEAIGYGMGKKDFAAANCVRIMLGKTV